MKVTRRPLAPLTASATVVSFAALGVLAAGCSSPPEDTASGGASEEALSTASYSPAAAVAFAQSHWSDGVGECAEFVYDCLHAGGLGLAATAWVPTLVSELSSIRYEEHEGSGAAAASAGDVVVFSTGGGSAFCGPGPIEGVACGHTCLVTVGGSSASAIEVDCHNTAHSGAAVSYFLSEYPHYRIYHTASGARGGSGEGCYSSTLGEDVADDACVETSADVWYQCDDGTWVPRFSDATACSSVHPY